MSGSKKSPSRPPGRSLDLGLGEIIAPGTGEGAPTGAPTTDRTAPVKTPAPPSPHRPNSLATMPGARPRSEYGALAERGEWRELLAVTEQRTSGGGQGELAPRFWWVRASVALGSVPLSILAAPLETVTREIAESVKRGGLATEPELVGAAASLLVEVSGQLGDKGDFATALTFAERAFRLAPQSRDHLRGVVSRIAALPEPSPRRDPAGVRLRERSRKLGGEIGVVTPSAAVGTSARVLPVETARPVAAAPTVPFGSASPRSGGMTVRSLIIILAVGIGVAALLKFYRGEQVSAGSETVIALVAPEHRPELTAPPIERLASLSQLDAIFYDFDRGGERRAALVQGVSGAPVAPVARSGAKEVVNTRGPVEPPDVLSAVTSPQARAEDDVGAILFGAPKPRFPTGRSAEEPRPQPVERFAGEREFVVLTSTRVLTRPSFTGSPVAELVAGDKVRGEGMVGDWLKIRSRNGQVGYILSQDVKAGG